MQSVSGRSDLPEMASPARGTSESATAPPSGPPSIAEAELATTTRHQPGARDARVQVSAYIDEKIQGIEREIQGFGAEGAEGLTAPQAIFF